MAQDTSPTAPGIGPALWVAILLCLAIGVGILVWAEADAPEHAAVSEETFRFEPLRADTDRIDSERTRLRGTETYDTEAVEELRRLYREANRAQFNPPSVEELQAMQKGLAFQAEEALLDTDVGGFVAAGRPIFEACVEGLDALLADVRSGTISLEDAQRNPPEATYAGYRDNCGNVLAFLRQTNLVDAEGNWTNRQTGPAVFSVLGRYRWAHLIDLRAPPMAQLTPAERELLIRWRIENSEAYPPAKRRQFIEDARRHLEGYPALQAEGRLAIERGDWKTGLARWQQACEAAPDDAELQAQCAWLRQKVE